jgi:Holliday junction resolvase RusA-like endonuclease
MTQTISEGLKLSLIIPGKPISQGNPQTFTKGGKAYPISTRNHRNLVIGLLRDAWGQQSPLGGGVLVVVRFMFARPDAHYLPANSIRPVRELRPDAPVDHLQAPDTDKCVRLLFDAATIAGVWTDDSHVTEVRATKTWAGFNSTELAIYARSS